jgi:hypothetical protein
MRVDVCRHFVGLGCGGNQTCKAGINLRALVAGPAAGWFLRIPCRKGGDGACYRRDFPSAAEVEAFEREFEQAFEGTCVAKAEILDKAVEGRATIACPVCGAEMHGRVARGNGHVAGRCSTEGCLAFIE